MRIRLSIDEEFRQIAPPISKAEHDELEKSLIAEGCRDPIVIWNGVILDGHHRYEICRRRNIPFQVKDLHIDCREEAIAWICSNQLGRRNISEATRQYLIGKRYQAEKRLGTRNPEGYNQYVQKELSPQNEGKPLAVVSKYGIAANLGMEYGVAHSTIERYGRLAGTIDPVGRKWLRVLPSAGRTCDGTLPQSARWRHARGEPPGSARCSAPVSHLRLESRRSRRSAGAAARRRSTRACRAGGLCARASRSCWAAIHSTSACAAGTGRAESLARSATCIWKIDAASPACNGYRLTGQRPGRESQKP